MSTNHQVTLGTVYKRLDFIKNNPLNPTFSVEGIAAQVDLYHYIKSSPDDPGPADESTMVKDTNRGTGNTYTPDIYVVQGYADYILFKSVAGSPVVKTKDLIK